MQTDTKENGVQRGNLCITAGKKVVGIEVGGVQQQQDDHPTGTVHSTAQAIADQIAKDQYIVLPTQIATALPSFMKKVEQGPATHHIGFLGGELRC